MRRKLLVSLFGIWYFIFVPLVMGQSQSLIGGGVSLQVQTEDGTISGRPQIIKVTNGTITVNSDGSYSIDLTPGTGGDLSSDTATSVDSEVAIFKSTTGKLLKRASITGLAKLTSGVLSGASAGTDYLAPAAIGVTVQAYDADLDYLSTFTPTSNVKSILNAAHYAAIRTLMDLGTSTGTQLDYLNAATGTTGTTSQKLVFDTSPTLVTPNLGTATATSINKVAFTAPASGSTLRIEDGKTLRITKTMQLTSADDTTVATFPAGAVTVGITGTLTNGDWCRSDGTSIICDQTAPTGSGTITKVGDIATGEAFTTGTPGKTLIFNNVTSGTITVQAVTGALGTGTLNYLPAATGYIQVGSASSTTAGQVFQSTTTSGSGTYSTATYPLTTTKGKLLISTNTSVVGELAVGSTGQLLVGVTGDVPAWGTDLPTATTIGSAYVYRAGGTDVAVADGGTNLSSYAIGDILYASAATTISKLADVAAGQPLLSGGITTAPAYAGYTFSGTAAATYTFPESSKTIAANDGSTWTLSSQAQGDGFYASSGSAMARSGQSIQYKFLITNGASANPSWSAYVMRASIATGDIPYGSGQMQSSALNAGQR